MLNDLLNGFLYEYSYIKVFIIAFLYFLILYFVLGPFFAFSCKTLNRYRLLNKIIEKDVSMAQLKFEMLHSSKSIILFGISSLPIIYFIRGGIVELLPNSILNVTIGVVILTIWNEVHFYTVHRLMHIPFFMKNVHFVHHRSHIPTVFSVYSFHWLEASLLSTVPLIISPFVPFAPVAIFLYPLASILLNYAGHCNYRFGNGSGTSWKLFGTRHNEHHAKGRKEYGFASNLLDILNSKLSKNKT